jgi:hypothetical protein
MQRWTCEELNGEVRMERLESSEARVLGGLADIVISAGTGFGWLVPRRFVRRKPWSIVCRVMVLKKVGGQMD